ASATGSVASATGSVGASATVSASASATCSASASAIESVVVSATSGSACVEASASVSASAMSRGRSSVEYLADESADGSTPTSLQAAERNAAGSMAVSSSSLAFDSA